MIRSEHITIEKVRQILEQVTDPEIPVLSIIDLGILRDIRINGSGLELILTPTYSGCPAMDTIRIQTRMVLLQNGIYGVKITTLLSPAWTTDWMTESGKEKLRAFGIAPPNSKQQVCDTKLFHEEEAIQCPHCRSYKTRLISQFGSTACKALYQCNDCREPFDYFKCH
jgi:ring-1,2-phenylacetyl-CoA epoxidase subunit PaaD